RVLLVGEHYAVRMNIDFSPLQVAHALAQAVQRLREQVELRLVHVAKFDVRTSRTHVNATGARFEQTGDAGYGASQLHDSARIQSVSHAQQRTASVPPRRLNRRVEPCG